MGSGGRPRKPTRSKIIQGTFRRDRAAKREPAPKLVAEVPKVPKGLPKIAGAMWRELAPELVEKRLLTVVDLRAFEVVCVTYAIYRQAYQAVTGRGRRTIAEYLRGQNSQTIPEFNAMMRSFSVMKAYMTEFGLTPASRGKLDIPEPKDAQDEMERLLNEQA